MSLLCLSVSLLWVPGPSEARHVATQEKTFGVVPHFFECLPQGSICKPLPKYLFITKCPIHFFKRSKITMEAQFA